MTPSNKALQQAAYGRLLNARPSDGTRWKVDLDA